MKVRFVKERLKWRGEDEEDVLVVYVLKWVGELTCRVGFLPQHLASTRVDEYDGILRASPRFTVSAVHQK